MAGYVRHLEMHMLVLFQHLPRCSYLAHVPQFKDAGCYPDRPTLFSVTDQRKHCRSRSNLK